MHRARPITGTTTEVSDCLGAQGRRKGTSTELKRPTTRDGGRVNVGRLRAWDARPPPRGLSGSHSVGMPPRGSSRSRHSCHQTKEMVDVNGLLEKARRFSAPSSAVAGLGLLPSFQINLPRLREVSFNVEALLFIIAVTAVSGQSVRISAGVEAHQPAGDPLVLVPASRAVLKNLDPQKPAQGLYRLEV